MKRSFLTVLIVALALVAQTASAGQVSFDFASVAGSTIKFTGTGDTIEFPNAPLGYDFAITDATAGTLVGMSGNIGGTFTVGAISPISGGETASVSGNGTFSVYDGANTFSATINLLDITVYNGTFGATNGGGVANLSNFSYPGGTNTALLDIVSGAQQTVVMTFQFSPLRKKTLTQLMTDGQVNSTSYSGSMSSVPEPSMLVLLAGAAIGLVAFVRRRKTA